MENWYNLTEENMLEEIVEISFQKPVILFKHSIRCPISANAKDELQKNLDLKNTEVIFYYLDLITYRNISNAITQKLAIPHESPQVIILKDGKPIYDASHWHIKAEDIKKLLF